MTIFINCALHTSPKWVIPALLYPDFPDDGDDLFGPLEFDKVEEPPPVHIIYPRPYNQGSLATCASIWLIVITTICNMLPSLVRL